MAKHKLKIKLSLPFLLSIILLFLSFLTFEVIFSDKFFPGLSLGDTRLTFMTKSQALQVTVAKFENRTNKTLEFTYKDQTYQINLVGKASIKSNEILDQAFALGHQGPIYQRLADQLRLIFPKKVFKPEIDLNLGDQIQEVAASVHEPAQNAQLSPDLSIKPEKVGLRLDDEALNRALVDYILFGRTIQALPVKADAPNITTIKVQIASDYLTKLNQEPIKLSFETNSWKLDTLTLFPFLDLTKDALLDKQKLENYLSEIASTINQPLKEAQFEFNPVTFRVSVFQPAQKGQELDIIKTTQFIALALENKRPKNITLPVTVIEPKIQTNDINNLGIKERIGQGISHFAGSIPNRVYNVNLTAAKINGVLIPPGQIFSFNKTVGDITAATGFKEAYVIKEGRTVLDDGGGVCQDSTTLFRAVLNAGLPVVKRTAHAYRVGYYEQGFPTGLDATVFYPTVDFQFKNDTSSHILIQAYTEGTTLYVDLYGTSDGRVATLTKPVVTDQTPPPPELRQDDPTLTKGTVKQVDFPAWGAKVSFGRTVKRGGEVLVQETFRSNYKPWQAVYLVGTGG